MILGDEMERDRTRLIETREAEVEAELRARRDRFAAAALEGMLASQIDPLWTWPEVAKEVWRAAQAVLDNEPPIASSSMPNPERAHESAPGAEGHA